MSLLQQIQHDATSSDVSVSNLLRKCKILAYKLGNEDFKSWVEHELNGYPKDTKLLPSYRILESVHSKGNFSGAFGTAINNAGVPTYNLPDVLKENLTKALFFNSIASLESLTNDTASTLSQEWDPLILAEFGDNMYENFICMQAWKVIPISFVIGIVDTIKTKILNFVLEIEMIDKNAGEVAINSNPIPQEKINQIFNISITGNVQNLASGNNQSTIDQEVFSDDIFQKL